MKRSEAFKMAQVAVLNSDLSIKVKTQVLEALLWEEEFAKMTEDYKEKKEAEKCQALKAE